MHFSIIHARRRWHTYMLDPSNTEYALQWKKDTSIQIKEKDLNLFPKFNPNLRGIFFQYFRSSIKTISHGVTNLWNAWVWFNSDLKAFFKREIANPNGNPLQGKRYIRSSRNPLQGKRLLLTYNLFMRKCKFTYFKWTETGIFPWTLMGPIFHPFCGLVRSL